MRNTEVRLELLKEEDREQFIRDNQEAFKFGAMEEFGCRDDHFEEDGEIISRETINSSIDHGIAYRILLGEKKVGGAVISIDGKKGDLELLFTKPQEHSKGIGYSAWCLIEELHPEVELWETCTPYFEKRNIHFYVNRCGFHIVEFYHSFHPDPHDYGTPTGGEGQADDEFDGMFRFEKVISRNESKRNS